MISQKEQIERIVMQGRKFHKEITFNTIHGTTYTINMRPYWNLYKKMVLRLIKLGSTKAAQDLIDQFDITRCKYGYETESKVYAMHKHMVASGMITYL